MVKKSFNNTKDVFLANGYYEWKGLVKIKYHFIIFYQMKLCFSLEFIMMMVHVLLLEKVIQKLIKFISRQPVLLKYDNFDKWFDKTHDLSVNFL